MARYWLQQDPEHPELETLMRDEIPCEGVPLEDVVDLPHPVQVTMSVGGRGNMRLEFEPGPDFGWIEIEVPEGAPLTRVIVGRKGEVGEPLCVVRA